MVEEAARDVTHTAGAHRDVEERGAHGVGGVGDGAPREGIDDVAVLAALERLEGERRARRVVGTYETRAELVSAIVASCSMPGVCAPLSCLWTRCDGFVPLTVPERDGVPVLWGAMPPAYSMVELNLPFVWWAQAASLSIPLDAIGRAILAGFARVGAIESAFGKRVVRDAADAARERARRSWAEEGTKNTPQPLWDFKY